MVRPLVGLELFAVNSSDTTAAGLAHLILQLIILLVSLLLLTGAVSGVLTYDDVTNVDSIGLVTADLKIWWNQMLLVVAQPSLVLLHSLMTLESKVSLRMYLLQLHS